MHRALLLNNVLYRRQLQPGAADTPAAVPTPRSLIAAGLETIVSPGADRWTMTGYSARGSVEGFTR
jgi:hypothetical protein